MRYIWLHSLAMSCASVCNMHDKLMRLNMNHFSDVEMPVFYFLPHVCALCACTYTTQISQQACNNYAVSCVCMYGCAPGLKCACLLAASAEIAEDDLERIRHCTGCSFSTIRRVFSAQARCPSVTEQDPLGQKTNHVWASIESTCLDEVLVAHDMTMLYLTDGQCRPDVLHVKSQCDLDYINYPHGKVAQHFKPLIRAYNPDFHMFLLVDDYATHVKRQPVTNLPLRHRIPFHIGSTDEVRARHVPAVANSRLHCAGDIHVEQWVKEVVEQQCNVMCCAPAGYGKSHTIKHVLATALQTHLRRANRFWVTGSTNMAALALDGKSIHSAAGLQRGRGTADNLIASTHAKVKLRWKHVQVVIIEEVSMLSARFMDLFDEVARKMKHNNEPFGGLQLILVGDFMQLKQVPDVVSIPDNEREDGVKYRKLRA